MAQMNTLSIDIETYSDIDLKKCGVYRYACRSCPHRESNYPDEGLGWGILGGTRWSRLQRRKGGYQV